MIEVSSLPFAFVVAQASPGMSSFLQQMAPMAAILVIMYVVVLMPMRRQKKKIAEFQASLKVGDRVIAASGIYGQVTRLTDASVQLQIADKVKIEVSRAS